MLHNAINLGNPGTLLSVWSGRGRQCVSLGHPHLQILWGVPFSTLGKREEFVRG